MSTVKRSLPPVPVPSDNLQRRAWIKFQLGMRGLSIASLAEKQGVSRQAVWKAMTTSYPKMEKVIARAIGVKRKDIWPERYKEVA